MKLSLRPILDSMSNVQRFDANETAFLERQLTFLRAKTYEVQYADLVARTLMPMATDIPESAKTYVFPVLDRVGKAKIITTNDKAIPRVDVTVKEVTGKVYPIGAGYGFDMDELAEAVRLGIPLANWKANAARRAIEEGVDECLSTGAPVGESGLVTTGFINNAAVEAQGITNLLHWLPTSDGEVIAADAHAFVNAVVEGSNQKFKPDTLALSVVRFHAMATAKMTNTDSTALEYFLRTSPYIKNVVQWYKLDGAGAGSLDRAVAYVRSSDVLEGVVPREFMQLPPERRGLEVVTDCLASSGGVKVYQPSAMIYGDHADS